jgi:tetrahydromethanopterin S-methyltransferase subunit A
MEDGTIKPKTSNAIVVGKYDLIFSAKPKSDSMSSERLRQNVELLKVLQSTDPELVKYLIPDILKDSDSPSAKKIRDIITQKDKEGQNSPQAQQNTQLQSENAKLEMMLKQSQANLNNTRAQAMMDKNKIDLQKAFSGSLVAKEMVQAKNSKNQLDAMRGIN